MLSDRPYMRGDYPREKTSVLTWLICSIIAGFVLQLAANSRWLGGTGGAFDDMLALSGHGLRAGRLWALITHVFLHDTRYIFHGLGSVLMIYFVGRELLPMLGARRFLGLFFGATVAGGLAWTAVHWGTDGTHTGAMAPALALLTVFACFFPNRQVDVLLLFIPVSVRPKYLAIAFAGLAVFWLGFFELRDVAQPFGQFTISGAAQLGGIAAGWIYFRFIHDAEWRLPTRRGALMRAPAPPPAIEVETESDEVPAGPDNREGLRAEIDRILDKINSHGFGSLTPKEKRLLDDAKNQLSRR